MQITATQKFIRVAPRKMRLVANAVRGMTPEKALETLPNLNKAASEPLSKVIKTAIANAKVQGISDSDLKFNKLEVNEGPRLKRGRPVSRGRWHPYKRRMSHISIVLESIDKPTSGRKSEKVSKAETGSKSKVKIKKEKK
jgi:large subunit ribosomal protein L22